MPPPRFAIAAVPSMPPTLSTLPIPSLPLRCRHHRRAHRHDIMTSLLWYVPIVARFHDPKESPSFVSALVHACVRCLCPPLSLAVSRLGSRIHWSPPVCVRRHCLSPPLQRSLAVGHSPTLICLICPPSFRPFAHPRFAHLPPALICVLCIQPILASPVLSSPFAALALGSSYPRQRSADYPYPS